MKFRKVFTLIILAYISGFMFFLNMCIPNLADDWVYANCDWSEIIENAYKEYFTWNSRFFACVVTRVVAKLPMWMTDICGTFAFMGLLLLVLMHALGKEWRKAMNDCLIPIMVWIAVIMTATDFQQTYIWHCGQANYLYTTIFVLGGLLPFRFTLDKILKFSEAPKKYGKWAAGGLCFLAPLVGCSNENTGVVAFLFAAAVTIYTWGKNPNKGLFATCCVIIFTACVLMLIAPGPQLRAAQITDTGTFYKLTLRIAKFHAKSLLLYIPTLICLYRLWRRHRFTYADILLCTLYAMAGIMCDAAFFATSIIPPARALNISHIFMTIACVRVIWLDYSEIRHKIRIRIPVFILSLLPLLSVPNYMNIRQYMSSCYNTIKENEGKDVDIILPPYTCKDNPFFTNNMGLVSSEEPDYWANHALAKLYNIRSIKQSNIRCSYEIVTPDLWIQATSYDIVHFSTRTEFKVQGKQSGNVKWLHVACPPHWQHLRTFRSLFRYFFVSDAKEKSFDDLTADGYAIFSITVGEDGSAVWLRGEKFSPIPEAPVLWVAESFSPDPGTACFHRAAPTRPEDDTPPVWMPFPAMP